MKLDLAHVRVCLSGYPPAEWKSLRRTHDLYLRALRSRGFQVVLENGPTAPEHSNVDAFLGFWGAAVWQGSFPRSTARIACLHGGAVVNYRELGQLLSRLNEADSIICNCLSDIQVIQSLPLDRLPSLDLLALPVGTSFQRTSTREGRQALGLRMQQPTIGFVGRLVPQKGLHYFIQVLDYCRHRIPGGVSGIVVGDFWPDYGLLNALGKDYRAYIAGVVSARDLQQGIRFMLSGMNDEDLRALYSAIDLLVHPTVSMDENFGYVPLEALACGTPVTATAYGGLKDTVARLGGVAAVPTWVTDEGVRFDLHRLMSNAARCLADPTTAERLAEEGLELVRDRHSFDSFARRLQEIIVEAVVRARTGAHSRGSPVRSVSTVPALGEGVLDWEALRPAISHYVSDSTDSLAEDASVYLWHGRRDASAGTYRIEDPAWPAVIEVAPSSQDALGKLPKAGWGLPRLARPATGDPSLAASLRDLANRGILAWTAADG